MNERSIKIKTHAKRLTQKSVDSIPAPKTGQIEYPDLDVRGFGLRVSRSGTKSWYIWYRTPVLKRHTFGRYPEISLKEARDTALQLKRSARSGIDLNKENTELRQTKLNLSFPRVLDDYIQEYAKVQTKSWKATERYLKTEVLPRYEPG